MLMFVMLCCPVQIVEAQTTTVYVTGTYHQTEARKMISLMNELRTGEDAWYLDSDGERVVVEDLTELTYDYSLEKIAMQRAADIVLHFDALTPDGFLADCNGSSIFCGPDSAMQLMVECKADDAEPRKQYHRETMLYEEYTSVGVACFEYDGCYYWAICYGKDNSGEVSTVAVDKEMQVGVFLYESLMTPVSVTPSKNNISLVAGSSTTVPTVTAKVTVQKSNPEGTVKTITVPVTWSVDKSTIASVSNGMIKAKQSGYTLLKTNTLGYEINVSLTVIPTKVKSVKQVSPYAFSGAKIAWTDMSDVDGYDVYYATSKAGTYKFAGRTSEANYIKTGLKAGQGYYFKVRAYKIIHEKKYYGAFSDVAYAVTKPNTPTVSLAAGGYTVKATWNHVPGAYFYEVYMGTKASGYRKIATVKADVNYIVKRNLAKGKVYYVRVRTVGKTAQGEWMYSPYSTVKAIKTQ